MDPRVPLSTGRDGRVYALGRFYPDLPTAEREVAAIIQRRERISQRSLTGRELREGVHGDSAQNAVRHFKPIQSPQPERDPNPYRRFELQAEEKNESPRKRRDRLAREWDEKQKQVEADKAHRESPRYLAAQEFAEATWEATAFDPAATPEDLIAVERLRRQVDGDLDAFKSMSEGVAARQRERHGDRTKAAQAAFDKAKSQLEALQPRGEFEGSFFTPPGSRVTRTWNATDGERIVVTAPGVSQTGESYTRILHSWPTSEAPAEVAKMAPNFKESPNE